MNNRYYAPVALLLLLTAGCWEEIRYDPSKYDPSKYDPDQSTESTASPGKPIVVDSPLPEPKPPAKRPIEPPVVVAPSVEPLANPTLATLPLAWQLGSQWSMAVALYAKGLDVEHWTPAWEQAVAAAESLQVELPPLPEDLPDQLAQTIAYLAEAAGPELSRQLGEQHNAQHAALVELATKTNVLLLIYSPRNEKMEPIAQAIERAAMATELPAALWQPLITLLADRAPFAEVKPAVFQMHQQVTAHLAIEPSLR